MNDLLTFTQLLSEEFEDIPSDSLDPDMDYRDIPDFSSMHALIIIAHIDNEYDVLLSAEDLKSSKTIKDLHDLVNSKL